MIWISTIRKLIIAAYRRQKEKAERILMFFRAKEMGKKGMMKACQLPDRYN